MKWPLLIWGTNNLSGPVNLTCRVSFFLAKIIPSSYVFLCLSQMWIDLLRVNCELLCARPLNQRYLFKSLGVATGTLTFATDGEGRLINQVRTWSAAPMLKSRFFSVNHEWGVQNDWTKSCQSGQNRWKFRQISSPTTPSWQPAADLENGNWPSSSYVRWRM